MSRRTARILAPLLTAAVLSTTLLATPASARPAPSPEPTPSATAAPSTEGQYSSLTGALMNMYAKQSGTTLQSYLSANQMMVKAAGNDDGTPVPGSAGLLGAGGAMTAADGATELSATSVGELDAQLAGAGYTLDLRNYSSMRDLAADVVAKSHTADGAVTIAGAQWMTQLGSLRSPTLSTPTVGGASMPGIPQEALAFGLLLDQSVAGTVLNAPDLFAAAAANGVGSEALAQVFSQQMMTAWEASNESLTNVLPNKCTGAMLAVMASGDKDSAQAYTGCAPACTTGGLYLNGQTSSLFGAQSAQMSGELSDNLWTYETLLSAQQWRTRDLLEQNPGLVQGLLADDGTAGGAQLCGVASQSTKTALSSTLPGVFSNLRPQG